MRMNTYTDDLRSLKDLTLAFVTNLAVVCILLFFETKPKIYC